MKTIQIVGIGIIIGIVTIGGFTYYNIGLSDKDVVQRQDMYKHREYCSNWSNYLDEQRERLENISDADFNPMYYDSYNKEISEYNKECVY